MQALDDVTVGLVGDFCLSVAAHHAIPRALDLAGAAHGIEVTTRWIESADLESRGVGLLRSVDAIWCTPGSPYNSMDGVLRAIRYARESGVPFLGTCGGFQHALLEYARNVLGLEQADHSESNPKSTLPLIAARKCPLDGVEDSVSFEPGTRLSRLYGEGEFSETFRCRYGFNPNFAYLFSQTPLKFCASDGQGEVCAFELEGHPLFVGTLFQPEHSALSRRAHPLIEEFVKAALLQAAKPSPLQQVLGL